MAGKIPTWTLGERLRKARTDAGHTADTIAAELHVTPQTVRNYETGRTRPQHPMVNAWAEITDVDGDWLRHGEHQRRRRLHVA